MFVCFLSFIYNEDKKSSSPRPLEDDDCCFSFCLRFASMACKLFFFGFFFFLSDAVAAAVKEEEDGDDATGDEMDENFAGETGNFRIEAVVEKEEEEEEEGDETEVFTGIDWRVSSGFVDLTYPGCEPCR